MGLSTQLVDAAATIAAQLNEGNGSGRASLGGGATAFGWTAGLPRTIANYTTVAKAEGMSVKIQLVTESPTTPAAIVAAEGSKPEATVLTARDEPLKKFAGFGLSTLEDHLDANNLSQAIASVLSASSLKAFEGYAVSVLDTVGGAPVAATSWLSAITTAQGTIIGNGGTPTVLVISAADYGAMVSDIVGSVGFSPSSDSPLGVLGTSVHVSPTAAAGKAWVLDGRAALAVEHSSSPLAIVDSLSLATTNQTRIILDLVAGFFVADPALVVEITAPVAA